MTTPIDYKTPVNMVAPQTSESTSETSPFIPRSTVHQTPKYPKSHEYRMSHGKGGTKVKVSHVILGMRAVSLAFGFPLAICLSTIWVYHPAVVVLIVFSWFSSTWNALMAFHLPKSLGLSLVLDDGRAIRIGSRDDEDDDGDEEQLTQRKRRSCMRAFWIDLPLVVVTLAFLIWSLVEYHGMYSTLLCFNFAPVILNLFITLLGSSPNLLHAHFRFEQVGSHITLP